LHETATLPPRSTVLLGIEARRSETAAMTDTEYTGKLDELDRLLNDPDVPMEPARVWSLLAELSHPQGSRAEACQGAD
jgi:hypothetical protein